MRVLLYYVKGDWVYNVTTLTVLVKEADEATKRKADEPSEDETVEKIAKLKETAAEVVAEAEQKLAEPLTEAEATA